MKLYFPYNLESLNNLLFCPLLFVFLLKSFFYSVVKDQRPTLFRVGSLRLPGSLAFTCFPVLGRRHRRLVGLDGLEPSTSRLSGARSSHLSYRPLFSRWSLIRVHLGGDEGNRTLDPLLAGQVLSQLSYTPIKGLLLLFQ